MEEKLRERAALAVQPKEQPNRSAIGARFASLRCAWDRANAYVYRHPWQVILLCLLAMLLTAVLSAAVTVQSYRVLLMIPIAAVFAFIARKAPAQSVAAALVLLGFSVLLPCYVYASWADCLQYGICFLMALVLLYAPSEPIKLVVCMALLLFWAYALRDYYVLMMGFALALYIVALLYRHQRSLPRQAAFLVTLACVAVLMLFVVRALFPEATDILFTVRTVTNMSLGNLYTFDKLILDPLPLDRSVPGFLGNYLCAAVRMLLPVELFASARHIPLALFQLLLTGLLLWELIKSRRVQARTCVYAFIIAFFLMSFVFEPDFGSWFRHEASVFPLLWLGVGADQKTRCGRTHGTSA